MTIPQSVIDAARSHVHALDGETDDLGRSIAAEPSDAFNCWESACLPTVDGLDPRNPDDNYRIRKMLEQAIRQALNAQCANA